MKKKLLYTTNYHKEKYLESAIKCCLSQTPYVIVIKTIIIHGK